MPAPDRPPSGSPSRPGPERAAALARPRLARALVLDELFDLELYQALRPRAGPALQRMLDELIPIEKRHAAFWQQFFGTDLRRLDRARRLKLRLLVLLCAIGGDRAIQLVLEAIEIYGVRKYLTLWRRFRGQPLSDAARTVLEDELRHEDQVVAGGEGRRVDPESIRSLFLGFNDGLVEILGAVSGFFAAFADTPSILIASSTVAIAGAFSMAAGAFVAGSSEREMLLMERERRAFLGGAGGAEPPMPAPLRAAILVGAAYLLGSVVPVLPVVLGARTVLASLVTGAAATAIVSTVLAFLSGMTVAKRLVINLGLLGAAVAVTYGIGLAARSLWGIAVS